MHFLDLNHSLPCKCPCNIYRFFGLYMLSMLKKSIPFYFGWIQSGIIGERLPIRYYLTGGMFASGLFTAMFGFGYFYNIHSLWFYIVAQVGTPVFLFSLGIFRHDKKKRKKELPFWNCLKIHLVSYDNLSIAPPVPKDNAGVRNLWPVGQSWPTRGSDLACEVVFPNPCPPASHVMLVVTSVVGLVEV